jgi:polyisoprenoid-binding protein YceI
VGQPFSFTITGDLTIRDITRSVTFNVTVTPESQDRLTGTASAAINRADYQLTIPSVPRVAGVSEQVTLELEFTAVRVP